MEWLRSSSGVTHVAVAWRHRDVSSAAPSARVAELTAVNAAQPQAPLDATESCVQITTSSHQVRRCLRRLMALRVRAGTAAHATDHLPGRGSSQEFVALAQRGRNFSKARPTENRESSWGMIRDRVISLPQVGGRRHAARDACAAAKVDRGQPSASLVAKAARTARNQSAWTVGQCLGCGAVGEGARNGPFAQPDRRNPFPGDGSRLSQRSVRQGLHMEVEASRLILRRPRLAGAVSIPRRPGRHAAHPYRCVSVRMPSQRRCT